MGIWIRIRSAVRGVEAGIKVQPKYLATMAPSIDEALSILAKQPTAELVEELEYHLRAAQKFLAQWRPDSKAGRGLMYIHPTWAKHPDDQLTEALALLADFRKSELHAHPTPETEKLVVHTAPSPEEQKHMKVFISHSSVDKVAAEGLAELIRTSLNVSAKEIRCTSVDGYKLPAGTDSNEQLRKEVFECQAFVALLSPSSIKSTYVMFELGARWGAKGYLVPIMIGGLQIKDLKAPLSAIHTISGTSEPDMHQFISDLGGKLSLPPEVPSAYGKALSAFTLACQK